MDERKEVVRIARSILSGQLDVLDGCRALVSHVTAAGLTDDPDAAVIVGVESETDDLPLGGERRAWHVESLRDKDARRSEYADRVRTAVLGACQSIVDKLSDQGG